ncbi:MAG: hypothetical protein U0842_12550 [Candidatus Binatia bacterium]
MHAWAAWRLQDRGAKRRGGIPGDRHFLERRDHKLLLNCPGGVNRKDAEGRNVFQGGFLGLDSQRIGVFEPLGAAADGRTHRQSDATSWMGMYCLGMLAIALELLQGTARRGRHPRRVRRALRLHLPR